MIKVPPTPAGSLRRLVQAKLDHLRGPDGGSTRVVEMAGKNIGNIFPTDPARSNGCPYEEKCLVDPSKSCSKASIIYEATCNKCLSESNKKYTYIGHTGSTLHARSISHKKDIRLLETKNSIAKHEVNHHPDDPDPSKIHLKH